MDGEPEQASVPVVTLHVPEVVVPTVTVAVFAVLAVEEVAKEMAMVSPVTKPVAVVPYQVPLRAMPVQPVQLADRPLNVPVNVTALLVAVVLKAAPV